MGPFCCFLHKFRCSLRVSFLIAATGMLLLAGCTKMIKVNDPQLKPIQSMLEANLPVGARNSAVTQFLAIRGYPTETSERPGTIVAIIRHVDTQRPQPVTARVTFYFDANGKLNTYEIVRTMNSPAPH